MATLSDPGDEVVVNTYSLTQAGQEIILNTTELGTLIQGLWNTFQNNYSSMPPYFSQILSTYETTRKTELANLLQRRQHVGQLLQQASSLFEFNEMALQSVFRNMNTEVNPNDSSLTNLTPPDYWRHSIPEQVKGNS